MAAEPVRAPALHIRPYHADRDRAGRPGISGGQGVPARQEPIGAECAGSKSYEPAKEQQEYECGDVGRRGGAREAASGEYLFDRCSKDRGL